VLVIFFIAVSHGCLTDFFARVIFVSLLVLDHFFVDMCRGYFLVLNMRFFRLFVSFFVIGFYLVCLVVLRFNSVRHCFTLVCGLMDSPRHWLRSIWYLLCLVLSVLVVARDRLATLSASSGNGCFCFGLFRVFVEKDGRSLVLSILLSL